MLSASDYVIDEVSDLEALGTTCFQRPAGPSLRTFQVDTTNRLRQLNSAGWPGSPSVMATGPD